MGKLYVLLTTARGQHFIQTAPAGSSSIPLRAWQPTSTTLDWRFDEAEFGRLGTEREADASVGALEPTFKVSGTVTQRDYGKSWGNRRVVRPDRL